MNSNKLTRAGGLDRGAVKIRKGHQVLVDLGG